MVKIKNHPLRKYARAIGMAVLFGAQILWPSITSATEYYVHAEIGNDANSGLEPDDAFASLTYATKQLRPGDTLYLRAGTYDELPIFSSRFRNSGTASSPIVIKSYADEIATIRSESKFVIQDLSWWTFEGFVFSSRPFTLGMDDTNLPESDQCTSFADNITFKNIRFQNSSSNAIVLRCARHISIVNNIFDNLRSRIEGMDTIAISIQYHTDDVLITGNHFSDIGADGIQLQHRPGARHTNIQIIGNEFEIIRPYRYRDENGIVIPPELQPFDNVGENGIDIKAGPGPIVITNNRFHGFMPTSPGQDASGGSSGITVHEYAQGITISSNYFYDSVSHLTVGRGNHPDEYPDRDLVITNNIFDEETYNSDFDNWIVMALCLDSVSNVEVFNNTFRTQLHNKAMLIKLNKLVNVKLFNNIFKNGRANVLFDGSMGLSADHNAWSGILDNEGRATEVDPVLSGSNDVLADDLMIDWATKTPLAGSPLIDAALPVGIVYDYYGAPVTGQSPDIGAVEFQSGLSDGTSLLVDLSVAQGGIPARITYPDNGPIEVAADIRNSGTGSSYSFDWSLSDNSLVVTDYNDQILHIDPAEMAPGFYRVHLHVTDSGITALSADVETLFEIQNAAPDLKSYIDSDGDGVDDFSEGTGDTDQDGIPNYLDAISDPSRLQGVEGIRDRYLLITDPGLSLRLGAIAFIAGQQFAAVTPETIEAFGNGTDGPAINAADNFIYPGGIYDFEVTGLRTSGQSIRVVLPQQTPIEDGAVIRKYNTAYGWQDFLVNEYNSIASAPGSNGNCPAPGNNAYRSGLWTGDNCIQLTLEDGGPNDADGLRNGRLRDPGGVGIEQQSPSNNTASNTTDDSGAGGGCVISKQSTFDPLFILLLVISTAGIYRHKSFQ